MLARKCPAVKTRVLYLESLQQLASSSVLGSSSATATISADWPEGEGEREREGKREEREAMDSGIAFLSRGGSKISYLFKIIL